MTAVLNVVPNRPTLSLYESDGQTKVCDLTTFKGLQWQHEMSAPGSLTFSLPLDDANTTHVTSKRIVKVFWRGAARLAARIEEATTELAVDGRRWRSWNQLPGVMDTLNDAPMLPEYGLRSSSGSDRTFGFMSGFGHWYGVSGNWTDAAGFPYSGDTGLKHGRPGATILKTFNPWWISKNDPYENRPPRSVMWFRKTFTTDAGLPWRMLAAADDYMWIYVDGEEVFTPDQQQHQSWRYLAQIDGAFTAGDHVIAVKVQNSSIDDSSNVVSLLLALQQTDNKGDFVSGPPLVITDDSWKVSDTTPGWTVGEVLSQLFTEATDGGISALSVLQRGFTDTNDSAPSLWDTRGEFTFPVGTGYLDVVQQFAETHADFDVDPVLLHLRAYQRMGTDKSGTVEFQLGSGNTGSLKTATVARKHPRYNSALIHLGDGSWTIREDTASVTAWGRAQLMLSLGSTAETNTAHEVADAQFAETGKSTFQHTLECSVLDGPQIYTDIDLGDSFLAPNEDGDGTMKVRAMAFTVDASDEVVKTFVEVREDVSA